MALCQASKEAVWLTDFLAGLGVSITNSIPLFVDNQGSIALARNPVFHDRSKHVDIQFHYTRELVRKGRIQLEYLSTKDMVADVLTKSLPRVQHSALTSSMGLS